MAEIDNYDDSSAQATDDIESSKENTDTGDEESSRDSRDTEDEDDDPLSLPACVRETSVENEQDEILGENNSNQPCENSVLSGQKNKDDNLCECVASLELSMMKVVAFIRDVKLRRAQKNKKNEVNEDYTSPTIDKDGAAVDVDEILPLAIIDDDLVAVDEYFAEKVNEQDEKREEEKLYI
uniref:Uncharacterized protein n=1 Tax=Solanum tuberosum TaxID=4113 RepID=M1B6M8_SOLTU